MRRILIALLACASIAGGTAIADYAVTLGSGTNFGSKIVSLVHYAQQLVCDPTTPAQCAAVDASGNLNVKQATAANLNATVVQGTAANLNATVVGTGTFPVQAAQSGTWTVQPGNTANTTPWLFQGNVSNASDAVATGSISAPSLAYNMMFNGTTWDRIRGDTTNGIWVNIKNPVFNANGQATMANSSPQTIASDQRVSTANTSVPITISTATTTQLVAASGSTKVYVTAWDVIAAGTGNIQLVYGTGANCGTGTTNLTGNYNLTAQAGISKGDGTGAVLITPASQAVCATTSAAVGMAGSLTFQQF